MEIGSDSEDFSPPSSPVLGYSTALRDQHNYSQALGPTVPADSETELVFCFNCKGRPRVGAADHSFSPDGLILRRQLITTLEILNGSGNRSPDGNGNGNSDDHDHDRIEFMDLEEDSYRRKFFGRKLDPFDPTECRLLLTLARKNIHILQIMANPRRQYGDDSEELEEDVPWTLRKEVCIFFNFLVSNVTLLKKKVWCSVEELEHFFGSFRNAFGNVAESEGWAPYLKAYSGYKDGNECSSAVYHVFHTMLELRWTLLIVFGMNADILAWILEDLIQLAWGLFTSGGDSDVGTQNAKQPFNCWCVKELWTMIRLLCEEMNVNFWTVLGDSLNNFWDRSSDTTQSKILFPLWLVSHVAFLSDYSLSGMYTPGKEKREPFKFNGYPIVTSITKTWLSQPGGTPALSKPCEVYHYLGQLLDYWGFDLELIILLWNDWMPKIDRVLDAGSKILNYFSSVQKWTAVVSGLCPKTKLSSPSRMTMSDVENIISKDPFFSFLRLLVSNASLASGKDWKKLKSSIGMGLTKNTIGVYGEMGLLRLSTLYLALAYFSSDTTSMCDRLKEILQYGKSSPARTKAVLRATATGVNILLQKSLSIADQEIASSFMSTVTTLLSQSPMDAAKKDNVMIYLDLLDCLPKTRSLCEASLERESLISPNLTMWLSNCGPDYAVRTLRVLNNLTSWIISAKKDNKFTESEEREKLSARIYQRTLPFLKQAVTLNENRIPSTDVEPMANLAADFTLFSKWCGITGGADSPARLFDHFALHERTCPEISQFYMFRLQHHQEFLEGTLSDLKFCQTWIRLNALGSPVPSSLSERVLGESFTSCSSNDELLDCFCKKSEEWSRGDVQNILQPLPMLARASVEGIIFKEKAQPIISSVIQTCAELLEKMEIEKVYIRGDPKSVGLEVINALIHPYVGQPPWEKLSKPVLFSLKDNISQIFRAIVSSPGFSNDPFLQRKVTDLVVLAVLGYVDAEMSEQHPAVRIMLYSEDHQVQFVLQNCISHVCKISTKDAKIMPRFVQAVTALKNVGVTSTVVRFLPGILSTYINGASSTETRSCFGVISYCSGFGLTPRFKDSLIQAFDSVMETTFAFKSRRWFDLSDALAKPSPSSRPQARTFLKLHLFPLYQSHVVSSEYKRGTGVDKSLRDSLGKLERDVATFQDITK